MPIRIEGDYPKLDRAVTGLYSFDRAVGNPSTGEVGLPLRSLIEIFGFQFSGKSTFAYFLASAVNRKGTVVPVDFEGFDIEYLRRVMEGVGFDGAIRLVTEYTKDGKPRPDGEMVDEMVSALSDAEVSAGILDSVSTYQSMAEGEGEIGEAFMGRRAREIGQFCRRSLKALRNPALNPKVVFVINHAYARLGGHGYTTAGGKVLEAAKQVSIHLMRGKQLVDDSGRDDFAIQGSISKLRYGGIGRTFNLACILGRGIHVGMTAMLDCVDLGIATREGTVKIGGTSVGRVRELVDAAADGQDKKFDPFIEALASYKPEAPKTKKAKKDASEA